MPGDIADAKIAAALMTLDRQQNLLRELHSYATDRAKTAAALSQAVKLAQDGLIDVSDIAETARRLKADGNVKISAADDLFRQTVGELEAATTTDPKAKLDLLTATLRSMG
jgi:hypothetical protein